MVINNKAVVTLSSGYKMPLIGLGTYFPPEPSTGLTDQSKVENTVKTALQLGYRHLDCAAVYKNEVAVGKGIKASGIPRGEIFVTSKLWNTEHNPRDVEPALLKTLKDLDLDYIDLYLIHWPDSWAKLDPFTFEPQDKDGKPLLANVSIAATWAAMEKLVTSGKTKSIGVSNFSKEQLEDLITTANIIPAVNQVQANPQRSMKKLLEWCSLKNIHITAWGPLSANRHKGTSVATNPEIIEIAKSINVTPVQLALSWGIQRGTSVIPKSGNEERLRGNFDIVELSRKAFERIDNL